MIGENGSELAKRRKCGDRLATDDGRLYLCQLSAGHDGPHQAGLARWGPVPRWEPMPRHAKRGELGQDHERYRAYLAASDAL